MKALLLLAIFCAVSYASISPQWTVLNDGGTKNFNWTEVTTQSAPVKGQWNTINYCGVANAYLNYTSLYYTVGTNYNTQQQKVYQGGAVNFLGDKTSFAGAADCEFFTFQVPQFEGSSFFVKLDLRAFDKVDDYYDSYQSSIKIDFDV